MYTTIRKWGNSQAVRIPKAVLEKAGLRENDRVEIRVENSYLLIIPVKRHLTLPERAAGYAGGYEPVEWDRGKPVGTPGTFLPVPHLYAASSMKNRGYYMHE